MQKTNQWIAFALLLFLTSCSQNQQVKDSQLALIKTTNPNPVITDHEQNKDNVKEIKDLVSSLPELYDVAVIKGHNGTLVAYKVKHLQRFKMKKI
ncbi:sporulation protein, partial [Bacillus sp. JJ1764]